MEKIRISPLVKHKLSELVETLYEKEYFGLKVDAIKYVKSIYQFIYSIPKQRRKKAKNSKFGDYYCQYKINRQTTYYIFFDIETNLYFVRHITNNHSSDYPNLVS